MEQRLALVFGRFLARMMLTSARLIPTFRRDRSEWIAAGKTWA